MRQQFLKIALSVGILSTALVFQNCGDGFEASQQPSNSDTLVSESNGPDLLSAGDYQFSSLNENHIFILDRFLNQLFRVDLEEGERTIISGEGVGVGNLFVGANSIAVNADDTSIYVMDLESATLFRVDVATGDRTVVSRSDAPMVGAGVAFRVNNDPSSRWINVNADETKAYLYQTEAGQLIEVDLLTGDRLALTVTPVTGGSRDLHMGATHYYSINNDLNTLYSIDRATNMSTIVSSESVGVGPRLTVANSIVANADETTLYTTVRINSVPQLLRIDILTGDRTAFSSNAIGADNAIGAGPQFINPNSMTLSADEAFVYVIDYNHLVRVSTLTGDREQIFQFGLGSGPRLLDSWMMTLNTEQTTAYVTDRQLGLVAVDMTTGNRKVVASDDVGQGPDNFRPRALALNEALNFAYVVSTNAILQVDLNNGNRTVLSSDLIGNGVAFDLPDNLMFDNVNNRLVAVVRDQVYSVDIATGFRTTLSGLGIGQGDDFVRARSLTLVAGGQSAYVYDATRMALFLVDFLTGNRTQQVMGRPFTDSMWGIDLTSTGNNIYLTEAIGDNLVNYDIVQNIARIVRAPNRTYEMSVVRSLVLSDDDLSAYTIDSNTNMLLKHTLNGGATEIISY